MMYTQRMHSGLKFALPLMLAALLSCATFSSLADSNQASEYRIKAAFLYNFSRFITWPDKSIGNNGEFRLCILGKDPFQGLLDKLVGKRTQNSSFEIKRFRKLEPDEACQIVFISKTGTRELKNILSMLKDQPVLTVSDIEGFTARGGIIQFKLVDSKVRFNINIDTAKEAGLVISSKLLSLATVIRNTQ